MFSARLVAGGAIGFGLFAVGVANGGLGDLLFESGFEQLAEDNLAPSGGQVTSVVVNDCGVATVNFSQAMDNQSSGQQISYDICYSTNSSDCISSFTAAASVLGSPLSKTLSGLLDATTYYFVVRARDLTGNVNQNTEQISQSMDDGSLPSAPVLQATPNCGLPGSGSITLARDDSTDTCPGPGGLNYEYCRSTSSSGCDSFSPTFTSQLDVLVDQGLSTNTTYYYFVRAKDSWANVGPASAPVVSAKTRLSFSALIQPTLSATPGFPGGCGGACHSYTHASIVNAPSSCSGKNIVTPGNLDLSSLYHRLITSTCGPVMPSAPFVASATFKSNVTVWINEGACNN